MFGDAEITADVRAGPPDYILLMDHRRPWVVFGGEDFFKGSYARAIAAFFVDDYAAVDRLDAGIWTYILLKRKTP